MRVAVLCAMESEAIHLRERLGGAEELPLARWRRTRGDLAGQRVDIIVCGIGMINAAACASALCVLDRPPILLNYGCSGAHRDDLGPGDIVIGDRVVHFSAQIIRPDGSNEYMGFDYAVDGVRTHSETIPSAPGLVARAEACGRTLTIPPWPGYQDAPRVHVGPVASADIWTQHAATIRGHHDRHGSLCEEMEAAAIAQVAAIFGVPFLPIKDISNNELIRSTPGATKRGWPSLGEQENEVGRRAALLVEALIADLATH